VNPAAASTLPLGGFARERLAAALASREVRVGAAIAGLMVLVALFAPWLAPNDPHNQDLLATLLPPAWANGGDLRYPLGTDSLGRCVLSRTLYGARIALLVALAAALGAALVGSSLALLAGYAGGRIDWLVSRTVDAWMAFPPVVLSLLLMVGLGTGVFNVVLAIVLVDWTRFCRVVRAEVLVVRRRDYVPAARLLGFSHLQTLLREVLPGVVPLIITLLSLEMGIAVIVEATLSFVGLSVPASTVAWGVMIADARAYMHEAMWGMIAPVAAILITVMGFNLLGDGLRQSLDARLRHARV
jgi:peptide/nickel transport system permease protein